jgi:hypothetical protein
MEALMQKLHRFLVTSGTATAVLLYSLGTGVFAQDEPKRPINPAPAAESIPTPEQAWAALIQPISRQPSAGGAAATTIGAGSQQPPASTTTNTGEPPPSGPIGAFGQTIPAKFSKRNDVLDHVPIMATPLPLTQEQRKQIYDAVMAEKSQPVAGADALQPASELSPSQALNEMRPLPESVRGIDSVSRLYYIKAKDRVLLIEPNVRTVVGQITAS